jgi:hypothetical protein
MTRKLFVLFLFVLAAGFTYPAFADDCGKFKTIDKSCQSGSCSDTVSVGA